MKEHIFSRRLSNLALTCAALLGVLATGMYFPGSAVHAADHMSPHMVGVHPHHVYAGTVNDHTFRCQLPGASIRCYAPKQIRNAYSFNPLYAKGITGKGRTIVILDAYQAPSIASDLKSFDQLFGLNDPQLNIIAGEGSLTPFDPNDMTMQGWAGEIALDVEWAHAVAPDAKIDLVLAKSSSDDDLVKSLNFAVQNNLGDVISMSFGENESCLDARTRKAWSEGFERATKKHITLFASAGDQGASQLNCASTAFELAVSSPANDVNVTGVGGTILNADPTTGAYQGEVVWNEPDFQVGTGGGYSKVYKAPYWQEDTIGLEKQRGMPDVAYNAAINGGVLMVSSDSGYGAGVVLLVGGTSAGSPQWAGIIALADQLAGARVGNINPVIYQRLGNVADTYGKTFHDVTSGNNSITITNPDGTTATIQGYNATKGWDATTGWGSPVVSKFVPQLVKYTFDE